MTCHHLQSGLNEGIIYKETPYLFQVCNINVYFRASVRCVDELFMYTGYSIIFLLPVQTYNTFTVIVILNCFMFLGI